MSRKRKPKGHNGKASKRRDPKLLDLRQARYGKRNRREAKERVERDYGPNSRSNGASTHDDDTPPPPKAVRGRGDSGMMLLDPHKMRSDLQLLERALRQGYNVRRKSMLRRRLERIVVKETAEVVTKLGVIETESKADELAIAAARILTIMDKADQDRFEMFREKASEPQPTNTNVQVNVNVSDNHDSEANRKRIELAKLALKYGNGTLVIDGEQVTAADVLGTDSVIPGQATETQGADGKPW